jgi:hypothetical protein
MMRKTGPILFLAAAVALVFWKVIFHNEFTLLVGGDMSSSYYPWFDVASFWFKKGVLLLWDPYVYAGKFNMGELQPGLYYPLNWVFMLLPASIDGMQALIILDYFLAALFTYLFARWLGLSQTGACVSAVSFAIGGFNAQIYGYLNVLSGFVWMPLVLLLFLRSLRETDRVKRFRSAVGAGLLLGFSFLAGHHIPVIHTGLFLLLYSGFRAAADWGKTGFRGKVAPFAVLGSVACIALLATAFQWLPSAEWARHVYRWVGAGDPVRWGQQVPYSILQETSKAAPQDAVSLVLPYVSTSVNVYVGATVLFLALVGLLFARRRDTAFFGLAAVVYFFLSWGRYSALHGWANTFVPGMWFAREVFYYLVPFQMCLALLAGWGLDHLVRSYAESSDPRLRAFVRSMGWIMALLVVLLGLMTAGLYMSSMLAMDHPLIRALMSLASYVAVLGVLLFLLHSGRMKPAWFSYVIVVLLVVDLGSHFSADIQTKLQPPGAPNYYVREFWRDPPVLSFLKEEQRKGRFRIDDPDRLLPPNFGDVWRLDATMGHGATGLVDYFNFRGAGWGPGSNASALLNVAYFLSPDQLAGWESVSGGPGVLHRNPRAVPRAFVVSRFRSFSNDSEMLTWLASPAFNPRETVLLREADLGRIEAGFPGVFRNEQDGVRTRAATRLTAADKAFKRAADAGARRRLIIFQLPWGWSAGDETSLLLTPDRDGTECFLVINYLPGAGEVSRLSAMLEADGLPAEIRFELPPEGSMASGLQKTAVSLGLLDRREYRLSLTVPDDCSARLDSIRVTTDPAFEAPDDAGTARLTLFEPNRLQLKAGIRQPSFLVLSEVYYPGWEAMVDGKPAPLLKADYILRAVPLMPGEHTVELRFRSRTFLWGLVISALGLAGLACLLARPQFVLGSDCREQAKEDRNSHPGL